MARSLNAIISPFVRLPAHLVTRWRSRTVANADLIGFVVGRCFQCSAGSSKKLRSRSRSFARHSAAFSYFGENSLTKASNDSWADVEDALRKRSAK